MAEGWQAELVDKEAPCWLSMQSDSRVIQVELIRDRMVDEFSERAYIDDGDDSYDAPERTRRPLVVKSPLTNMHNAEVTTLTSDRRDSSMAARSQGLGTMH